MMSAARATPTPMAAGRLRPARLRRSGGGTGSIGTGSSGEELSRSADWSGVICEPNPSHLEELGLLVLEQLVDRRHVALGDLLQLLLGPGDVVLADLAVLGHPVELVLGVPADVADRDLGVLGLAVGDLDELLAALLGQLRERHPDDRAVVRGVDAQVGVADGPFNGVHRALVVGREGQHPSVDDVERGKLVDRRRGAVVVDHDLVEHARVGPSGWSRSRRAPRRPPSPSSPRPRRASRRSRWSPCSVGCGRWWRCGRRSGVGADAGQASGPITVPIFSPWTARAMLPSSVRLKTTIGRWWSRQRLIAVASATLSPRARNSS